MIFTNIKGFVNYTEQVSSLNPFTQVNDFYIFTWIIGLMT